MKGLCVLSALLMILTYCVSLESGDSCANSKTPLNLIRKKRYLTFPDHSNVVLTISLVKAFMTHAPSGWNIAIEIDVMYPMLNMNETNRLFRKKYHYRQKREFWERLENAVEFHNLNGRSCILRSVCEADTSLAVPGKSLVHDILRAVFTAPLHDEDFQDEIKSTYAELSDPSFCSKPNDCPFSFLDFVLSLNERY
ncbi:uncharacterized protein LOC101743172 [Bombyx mori]|uniref:Uncharacterized protein n=1 Tax=Bombyx mori TaxID=7091 RepID=A0A8R2DK65_BOMMO|nr:uncharacterized protein LOC101743172 [Bombyx mori]